jgi:hypothetical protein
MAKPVVSTTVGAEGLALTDQKEFIAADDAEAFADAVVSLLHNPARRHELGEAGRALVVERYSWGQVAREFEALCEGVAPTHDEDEPAESRAHMSRRRSTRHRGARLVARRYDEPGRPHRHF